MSIGDESKALKALQDAIYRDKVMLARAMTPAERLTEAFECTDMSLRMMLAGRCHNVG